MADFVIKNKKKQPPSEDEGCCEVSVVKDQLRHYIRMILESECEQGTHLSLLHAIQFHPSPKHR